MSDPIDDILDLTIRQGKTFARVFRFEGGDGNLIDFTGCSARMQGRLSIDSATTVFDCSTDNGKIVISATDVIVTIPATETTLMSFDKAYYDLEIVNGSIVLEECTWRGSIALIKEVTR